MSKDLNAASGPASAANAAATGWPFVASRYERWLRKA